MIKMPDGRYIASDKIVELEADSFGAWIHVRLINGVCRSYEPKQGQSIHEALDEMAEKINAASK